MFLTRKKAAAETAVAVSVVEDRYAQQVAELQGDIAFLTQALQVHREDVSLALGRLRDTVQQVRREIPEIPLPPVIPAPADLGPLGKRIDEVDTTIAYLLAAPVFSVTTVIREVQLSQALVAAKVAPLALAPTGAVRQWVRPIGE